ncbi:hypothetical protein SLEP1_g40859 [Rubroshorea leprosula]|uniref:TF-B3 domain-containing protein n=1 Tax=Rubroshorea leprosula TaxID=152421 RepID=A0AAV5L4T5_9ROSI|nr:hypothetical protein SLEP1_g40859 [Rubroshorea leprosula]
MAIIFENKSIESTDTGSRMKFPHRDDVKWTYLPFGCNNPGRCGDLPVIDEGDNQWTLTIENKNGQVFFTGGWKAFREKKGITDRHTISLYRDDEADLYRIIVGRN